MATATDGEYEEIAQTIRHDLVYNQYRQDIESLIRYIPNTADGYCLERSFPECVNLVFLNTGEAYGLEIALSIGRSLLPCGCFPAANRLYHAFRN